MFIIPSTEECDENNVGGFGPSSGKHKTQRGQTGGQSVAEQHTKHQYRTHQPQHTGSHSSE